MFINSCYYCYYLHISKWISINRKKSCIHETLTLFGCAASSTYTMKSCFFTIFCVFGTSWHFFFCIFGTCCAFLALFVFLFVKKKKKITKNICHLSLVTCHMSRVSCHLSYVTFYLLLTPASTDLLLLSPQ